MPPYLGDCRICVTGIDYSDGAILSDCACMFHLECLKLWIRMHGRCPSCRTRSFQIIKLYLDVLQSTDEDLALNGEIEQVYRLKQKLVQTRLHTQIIERKIALAKLISLRGLKKAKPLIEAHYPGSDDNPS